MENKEDTKPFLVDKDNLPYIYSDSAKWFDIGKYGSEETIRAYKDYVCWLSVSCNTNLSETFFREHVDRLNFYCLCMNPSVPEQFFRDFIYLCDFQSLSQNSYLSESFFQRPSVFSQMVFYISQRVGV